MPNLLYPLGFINMSRTYRKKDGIIPKYFFKVEGYKYIFSIFSREVSLNRKEEEILKDKAHLKQLARYNSDVGCKPTNNPPSQYIVDVNTKQRVKDKKEIQKYYQNPEYEPMCFNNKVPLGYWD